MSIKLIRTLWAIMVLALVGVVLVIILAGNPLSSSPNSSSPDWSDIKGIGDVIDRAGDTQQNVTQNNRSQY